ncbi:MAG: hypothetical protein FJX77_13330 [Armatimonadetes bacterium]|nr:hypothetical protein [Armatimonadota bacterium]
MGGKDGARFGARLFALNLRLAELDQETHRTRVQVLHLEARVEAARLAHLLGDTAPEDLAALRPELERSRDALERQESLLASVRKNQAEARVEYALHRIRERRIARSRSEPEDPAP